MATSDEGYQARYQKIKNSKLRSNSPNHYEHQTQQSPLMSHFHHDNNQLQLGKIVSSLTDRVDGLQVKIVNITNVVKLLQKYTETKDIQYQKQKQQEQYLRNKVDKIPNYQHLQMQTKLNQLQAISQRAKAQITAMEGLRLTIQRQNSKKLLKTFQPEDTFKTSSPLNTKQLIPDIQQIISKMQIEFRQQMNKKFDICMNFFKTTIDQTKQNQNQSINTVMLQQQLNKITLAVYKVQADCNKNNMIMQNKIQQIINYVTTSRHKQKSFNQQNQGYQSHCKSDQRVTKKSEQYRNSQHSPISTKSIRQKQSSQTKSKKDSTDKNIKNEKIKILNKITQQKKQKQIQLKQALKKKKQNQDKLKINK